MWTSWMYLTKRTTLWWKSPVIPRIYLHDLATEISSEVGIRDTWQTNKHFSFLWNGKRYSLEVREGSRSSKSNDRKMRRENRLYNYE